MVGRGKSKKARSNELSQRLKEDRISLLPDPLICHILSHLSTKKAVTTSVLSTRWRSLWLWLPSFELKSRDFSNFNVFVSFGDRFFDSSRVSCIDKLRLTLGRKASTVDDESWFTSWIEAAIKRKIQHLYVRWSRDYYFHQHILRLYSCETLVYLRLSGVILNEDVFVVLPRLKTMYLIKNYYPSEASLEKMISSCPVLENLKIAACEDDTKVYRVHSPSLKRLNIKRVCLLAPFDHDHGAFPGIVIDAPLLRCLCIDDHRSQSFIVNNLESNAKLDISLNFGLGDFGERYGVSSRRSSIRNFLSGISRVGNMTICPLTFKFICRYSELEPLPQFEYMSCLCVSLHASPTSLTWLKTFLESCPNLKSLILILEPFDCYHELPSEEMNQPVPECLQSSLEFVDFKDPISGFAAEIQLVSYLLENSAILKKLTLRLDSTNDEIFKKLFEIPRGSTKCEVVIL